MTSSMGSRRPSVAVISQAVGPPWTDGIINAMVATARELPEFDFHWFADRDWMPCESNFHASPVASVGSWGPGDKARFVRWVRSLEIDIAHVTFHPKPSTIALLRPLLRGTAIVQTIQTRQPAGTDLSRLLLTDRAIAVTDRLGQDLRAADVDATVISPAVDLERLPMKVDAAEVRRSIGVADSGPMFLYAGNYTTALGAIDAADAFVALAERLPDAQFVMANRRGKSAEPGVETAVRDRLRSLGDRMTILETVPNFIDVLAASDLLLFPAHRFDEHKLDMPLVILEAIALSVPVAAYGTAPLDELDAGSITCTAPTGDVSGLVASIAERFADDVATASPPELSSCFTPRASAEAMSAVYRDALASLNS